MLYDLSILRSVVSITKADNVSHLIFAKNHWSIIIRDQFSKFSINLWKEANYCINDVRRPNFESSCGKIIHKYHEDSDSKTLTIFGLFILTTNLKYFSLIIMYFNRSLLFNNQWLKNYSTISKNKISILSKYLINETCRSVRRFSY